MARKVFIHTVAMCSRVCSMTSYYWELTRQQTTQGVSELSKPVIFISGVTFVEVECVPCRRGSRIVLEVVLMQGMVEETRDEYHPTGSLLQDVLRVTGGCGT